MTEPKYEIVLGERFAQDLQRLAADARRDPSGRGAFLRKQVLSQIKNLAEGKTDGITRWGMSRGRGIRGTV